MKKLTSCTFGLVLALATTAMSFGQQGQPIKEDVKDAGKATGRAVKKTGKKVGHGTKKAVNKTAEKTAEGVEKVEKKTR